MTENVGTTAKGHSGETNILDILRVVNKNKLMIFLALLIVSVVAVIGSGLMDKQYRSTAVIFPVSANESMGGFSSLLAQFGGLASLAGVSAGTSSTTKLVMILKSRSVAEAVIEKEQLMKVLFMDYWDNTTNQWMTTTPEEMPTLQKAVTLLMSGMVSVIEDIKEGSISVSVATTDPQLSARIANAYLRELQVFLGKQTLTSAKRNRIFLEQQMAQNKEDRLKNGMEINDFSRNVGTGVLPLLPAVSTTVQTVSGVDAVDVEKLLKEKAENERKIAESKSNGKVPLSVLLENLMAQHQLLLQVQMTLAGQYEMAKIQEAKEDISFTVIDPAIPPEEKFAPKRAQICIISFMGALFISVFVAFFREYITRMKALEQA
ncbi:MAG TPA: Wzz/FepE/Etk N-terminal domain-containing protein [bacterium]|nr:Wzz/FepE/Etk N-terminal domain-containing protein [bacterium]